jgi:hypothetical protein
MIHWYEPTRGQKSAWRLALRGMPPDAAALAKQYPPWRLYRLQSGEKCFVGAVSVMAEGPPMLRIYLPVGLNPIMAEDDERLVDPIELIPVEQSDLPTIEPENDTAS